MSTHYIPLHGHCSELIFIKIGLPQYLLANLKIGQIKYGGVLKLNCLPNEMENWSVER